MARYQYFLSENDARAISCAVSDIGRGKYDPPCPDGLRVLYSAMNHLSTEAWSMMSHPAVYTTAAPAIIKAYCVLATAAAKVANEYWRTFEVDQSRIKRESEVAA